MVNRELHFSSEEGSIASMLAAFQAAFPARARAPHVEAATYLDTPERRILSAGGALEAVPGHSGVELRWRQGATDVRARASDQPRSAKNLPAGPLRAGLTGLIAGRRLVPLVLVERRVEEHELCDEEQKTVARLRVQRRRARGPEAGARWHPLPTVVQGRSVRGYAHVFADLEGWLRARPELRPHDVAEPREALGVLGRLETPPAGLPVELLPEQPALETIRLVLRPELEAWTCESERVRTEGDPESLHDARVALRRARSILRQLRSALPDSASRGLVQELRWLGEESGAQRDLDVLLGEFESLGTSLPVELRAALEDLRAAASEAREAARVRFRSALESERHRALLTAWRGFVEGHEPHADVGRAGHAPILALVSRRIQKRHLRLVHAGRRLGPESPPEALHELRLAGKKLRYLVDVFQNLFPAQGVAALLQALKQLQDALGSASDARRQAQILQELAERMHAGGRASAATLLAAGRLLGVLEQRRLEAAEASRERCASFAKRRELVEELLAPEERR
jgi:CHAD domain-containing protein